ncbi:hypothetical protein CUJ83_15335 [Methanocella sp. CWC-04]|uniref:DUF3108 domain-containing protein n=1 Tax=Methanooceanicella nereidis TaxID=2052831 RepID=A0AAP2W8P4_9EURY|nr:hypothetical protein [Methanocella sp. CWC-04]MCD1296369.1 hypothetical protein [Methanocella sp. CWC-04]
MNMKKLIPMILIVALFLAFSGCVCCCNMPDVVRPVVTPVPAGTGKIVYGDELFDPEDFSWFEYKLVSTDRERPSQTYISDVRFEYYNTTYNGIPAKHVNMSTTSKEGEMILEYYYDLSTRNVLNAHMYGNASGIKFDLEVPVSDLPGKFSELAVDDPTLSMGNNRYELIGVEPVIVPMGAFEDVEVYIQSDTKNDVRVWVHDDIPVPLKITSVSDDHTSTLELIDWG